MQGYDDSCLVDQIMAVIENVSNFNPFKEIETLAVSTFIRPVMGI